MLKRFKVSINKRFKVSINEYQTKHEIHNFSQLFHAFHKIHNFSRPGKSVRFFHNFSQLSKLRTNPVDNPELLNRGGDISEASPPAGFQLVSLLF